MDMHQDTASKRIKDVNWWIMLTVAVIAVPAFALLTVATIQPSGIGIAIIFILSCWACTYAALRVVKNPRIAIPYLLEKVTFSEAEQAEYAQAIAEVDEGMTRWKRQYEQNETGFMQLAKQPAWDYLDELMGILRTARASILESATILPETLKNLDAWMTGVKPATVESYMQALRAAYGYSRAAAMGKQVQTLYPEVEKGLMTGFDYAPNQAKAVGWRLLSNVRQKHPFVAAQLNHASAPDRDTPMISVPVRQKAK